MNKDQVKGRIHEAKGKVKDVTGKVVGNAELEQKGKIENAASTVQGKFGDLKSDIKNTEDNVCFNWAVIDRSDGMYEIGVSRSSGFHSECSAA